MRERETETGHRREKESWKKTGIYWTGRVRQAAKE